MPCAAWVAQDAEGGSAQIFALSRTLSLAASLCAGQMASATVEHWSIGQRSVHRVRMASVHSDAGVLMPRLRERGAAALRLTPLDESVSRARGI